MIVTLGPKTLSIKTAKLIRSKQDLKHKDSKFSLFKAGNNIDKYS